MSNFNYIDLANDFSGKRMTAEEIEREAARREFQEELKRIEHKREEVIDDIDGYQLNDVDPIVRREKELDLIRLDIQKNAINHRMKVLDSGLHEADFRRKEIIRDFNGYKGANYEAAGYVFPDGKMANINIPAFKRRAFDFQEISKLQKYFEPGTEEHKNFGVTLRAFLEEGNIAISPTTGEMYIHEDNKMTPEQKSVISNIIERAATSMDVHVYSSDMAREPKIFSYDGKDLDID